MTTDKGKPDWEKHALQFMELQASKGMRIKEYAELHGLKENTARRAINEVIKRLKNKSDQNTDQTEPPAPKKGRGRPRKSPPTTDTEQAAGGPTHQPGSASACDDGGEGASDRVVQFPQKNKKSDQKRKVITGEVIKNPVGAPKGNQNRLANGKNTRPVREDVEEAFRKMTETGSIEFTDEVIQKSLFMTGYAHLELMKRARDKSMRRILARELDEEDAPPREDGDGPVIVPVPPEFQMSKLLTEANYAITDQMRTLSGMIVQANKEVRDQEAHAAKMEAHKQNMRHKEEAHVLKTYGKGKNKDMTEAFLILERKDGGAIAASKFLEERGLKIPALIGKMVELEIKALAEAVDDSSGMTNEELDAYVAQEEAKRAGHHQWLADRQKDLIELIDKGGYGDFDADGNRRSDEMQARFQDDEEEDPTATADLYGEEKGLAGDAAGDGEPVPIEQEDSSLWRGADNFHDEEEDDADESIEDWQGGDN
ncbi:TPA: hypothetical protein LU109_003565 [Enterobacter hormaechei subsp. xiangfangensis]|nr:hypothetical protein [Enterobacter hormaechei subsp. xiangfangensis]